MGRTIQYAEGQCRCDTHFGDLSLLLHSVEIITSGPFAAGLVTVYAGAVQVAIELLWVFDGGDAAWDHIVKCALAMTLAMLGPTASAFDFHLLRRLKRIVLITEERPTDERHVRPMKRDRSLPMA